MTSNLYQFICESNYIEGIDRESTAAEIEAHERLLAFVQINATALGEFQSVIAPGNPLRNRPGMNVRVGNYIAPEGGPSIVRRLESICAQANAADNPWKVHVAFENLHPYMDGNGRTGRALWAWMMKGQGRDPFALSFLHRWYYQTLEERAS